MEVPSTSAFSVAIAREIQFSQQGACAGADENSGDKGAPPLHNRGRNAQLNIKVRSETLDAFYNIADGQKWVLDETLERALAALEKELGATPAQAR